MSSRRRIPFVAMLVAWLAGPALLLADRSAAAHDAEQASGQPAASEQPRSSWRALEEKEAARQRVVQQRTGRYLLKARKLLVAEKYDRVLESLRYLNMHRLNPYERALVFRVQAYAEYGKKEYDAAVASLQKALAEKSLTRSDAADLLFQIAQIQGLQKKWADAVDTLKAWFEVSPTPGSTAYFHLALAYFQLKDLDAALGPAQKAVELADIPQERWLQLLLAIQLTRRDYAAATPVLFDLLSRYPEVGASYWVQLSALYGTQGDSARALAVLELARRQGLLTGDRNLRRVAQLSQSQGVPLRAVRVLEEGLDQHQIQPDKAAYELLGNSWILARESKKGEQALARAADLSPTGDLYLRLAQVMLQNEQWQEATGALQSAIGKGGLHKPAAADLLLGIAYFNAGHPHQARHWFVLARQTKKIRPSADAWIEHIDRELEPKQTATTALSAAQPGQTARRRATS